MNINKLKVFVTVVNQQGFSAAARVLNMSPTAISKQIRSLEDLLGLELIQRTTTQFEVTDVGSFLYTYSKDLLHEVENLEDAVRSYKSEPSGKINVFSSMAFAQTYIVPYMKDFIAQYPKVNVNLDIADRIPDVRRENIDLCFGLIKHWDQDLIQKKLFETKSGIYAAPSYLKIHEDLKSRKDLENHRFIFHSNRPDRMTIAFKTGSTVEVKPSISVGDHSALLAFAKEGLGPIVLFDFIAKDLVQKGDLIKVLTDEEMITEFYYVFYPPAQYQKPAARVFLDFVVSKIH